MEGKSSRLERDDTMREAEKNKAVHLNEKVKIFTETHTAVIQAVKEARKEKGSELGDGVQKITKGAEMKENSDKETKRLHAFMSRGGDKEDTKKRICDEDNDLAVKEGGIQSNVNAIQAVKQNKMESISKNLEKGQDCKKENEVGNCSERLDKEKKRDKKAKKSKSSSERIQKKLEKIDAKICRILAKKREYEGRLKEAQERERQESEKDASLQEREVPTAVMGKPASDCTNPDLVTAASRPEHDASTKESEKGFSGSLSRTASLIEGTSAELMEEVAVQKTVAENLAKLLITDGSGMNTP